MKSIRFFKTIITLTVLLYAVSVPVFGQGGTAITAGGVYPDEMDIKAFTLMTDGQVKIDGALGLYYERGRELVFYGWILDSRTRKTVWHMLEDKGYFEKGTTVFKETISLPKGDYEVYYTAALNSSDRVGESPNIVARMITGIFGSKERSRLLKHIDTDELKLTVTGTGLVETNPGTLLENLEKDAVISIIKTGDDSNITKVFALSADTRLHIYALGEGNRNALYDFAWIENIDHGKRVWTMNGKNIEEAGGGDKNKMVDEEITLPAGKYLVHYITDDSHSFEEWNTLPPDDPRFWGITIRTASGKDRANVTLLENFKLPEPVLELTRVGNKAIVTRGLSVSQPVELRILCIGEGNQGDGKMYDHGWIVNATTREKVWKINGRRTDHAGGASKNRMIDETLRLEKGNYIVNYVSDGSHSYRKWNAAPPFDPERWGITLWVTDEKDRQSIRTEDPDKLEDENVIVKITRVGDDDSVTKTFTLDADTNVRIIAVGEGTSHDMADYGWIKSRESGARVWEMTYRKTDYAGGAKKNRMFNRVIRLEKGDYELHFKTDDSHSYGDWNAAPPDDPDSYGITLISEK